MQNTTEGKQTRGKESALSFRCEGVGNVVNCYVGIEGGGSICSGWGTANAVEAKEDEMTKDGVSESGGSDDSGGSEGSACIGSIKF